MDVRLVVHRKTSFAAAWLNGRSSGQWPTTDRPASCAKAPTFDHLYMLIGSVPKGLCSIAIDFGEWDVVAPEYMGTYEYD